MKQSQGFTLLELMIVIAIIGVVMAMALPAFSNLMQRNRLKSAVQSLQDDMQFARVQAIKKNINTVVTVKDGGGGLGAWCYGISTAGIACDCANASSAANCDIKVVSGAAFSTTSIANTNNGTVTFDSKRGTATPSVAEINKIIFSTADFAAAVSTDVNSSNDTTADTGRVISCDPGVNNKMGLPTMPNC